VKINDESLSLNELTAVRTIPLKSGGMVSVVFNLFATQEGTVLSITSPLISVGVSLVWGLACFAIFAATQSHLDVAPMLSGQNETRRMRACTGDIYGGLEFTICCPYSYAADVRNPPCFYLAHGLLLR
jgi:hypothetical protein